MRRADRLFQIIQILRRASRPITAETIAAEVEASKRTIYRDIADLMGQRVPIRGEAGLGYVLGSDFDMPPLMLTPDEIEAAILGAQWVAGRGDPTLARAARDLITKIASAVPERLRPFVLEADRRNTPGSGFCAGRLGYYPDPCLDSRGPQDPPDLSRRGWIGHRPGNLARYARLF